MDWREMLAVLGDVAMPGVFVVSGVVGYAFPWWGKKLL